MILINIVPLIVGTITKFIFFLVKGFGNDYIIGLLEGIGNVKYLEKTELKNTSIYTKFWRYLSIEWHLFSNTIIYILNFLKRRIK